MRMDFNRNGVTTLTLIWTILDVWNEERCCCAAEAVARPTWLSRLNLVAKFCAASRIDECIWGERARKSREGVGGIIGKNTQTGTDSTRTAPYEEQTECRRQRKAVNNANKKQSVAGVRVTMTVRRNVKLTVYLAPLNGAGLSTCVEKIKKKYF